MGEEIVISSFVFLILDPLLFTKEICSIYK